MTDMILCHVPHFLVFQQVLERFRVIPGGAALVQEPVVEPVEEQGFWFGSFFVPEKSPHCSSISDIMVVPERCMPIMMIGGQEFRVMLSPSGHPGTLSGDLAHFAGRNIRRDMNDELKRLEKEKHVSEDEIKKEHDEIQKITDSFIKKVEELLEHKEKEIMEV